MNGVAPSIDLRGISFPTTETHNKSSDSTLTVYIQGSISIDQINNKASNSQGRHDTDKHRDQ